MTHREKMPSSPGARVIAATNSLGRVTPATKIQPPRPWDIDTRTHEVTHCFVLKRAWWAYLAAVPNGAGPLGIAASKAHLPESAEI